MQRSVSPTVSVVLLSHNRPECLRRALDSVLAQSHANLEVIVVDNLSPASMEVARIVGRQAGVKLVQNPNNGYTGGMNRGIELAAGDYVYLTEDDIVLERDCVERLVEYLDQHPSMQLISPIVYNEPEGTIRYAGGTFTMGGVYHKKIYGEGELNRGQFEQPFAVDYIDGATMFARRSFWTRFKGFREEYFMYVEAVELCARVLKSGGGMAVVPRARARHLGAMGARVSTEIEYHKLKNFFSLYLLHAPARHLPEFICRYAVINTARTLLGLPGSPSRRSLKALLWLARHGPALLKERYERAAPALPFTGPE